MTDLPLGVHFWNELGSQEVKARKVETFAMLVQTFSGDFSSFEFYCSVVFLSVNSLLKEVTLGSGER